MFAFCLEEMRGPNGMNNREAKAKEGDSLLSSLEKEGSATYQNTVW